MDKEQSYKLKYEVLLNAVTNAVGELEDALHILNMPQEKQQQMLPPSANETTE